MQSIHTMRGVLLGTVLCTLLAITSGCACSTCASDAQASAGNERTAAPQNVYAQTSTEGLFQIAGPGAARPGQYLIPDRGVISLRRAVAIAGGTDATPVSLVRSNPEVGLKTIFTGNAGTLNDENDPLVEEGDLVLVGVIQD